MAREVSPGRALKRAESSKMHPKLQARTRAELSKNGDGIEQEERRSHRTGAYPCTELQLASPSSVNREEVRSKGGHGGGLKARETLG